MGSASYSSNKLSVASLLGTRNTCTFCRRGTELLQHPVWGRMLSGTPGHPALLLPLAAVGAAEATSELSRGAAPCEQGLRSKLLACSLGVRTHNSRFYRLLFLGNCSWSSWLLKCVHFCSGRLCCSLLVCPYVSEMCKTVQCQQPCQALNKPKNWAIFPFTLLHKIISQKKGKDIL